MHKRIRLDENGRFLDDEVYVVSVVTTLLWLKKNGLHGCISKQVVSAATACIPKNDSNRALMGAMQRQAVPLMNPEAPFVGTGMEHVAARDSGAAITAKT